MDISEIMSKLTPQQMPRNSKSKLGLNISAIQKYLELLQIEMHFSKISREGPMKYKRSFLNYLEWLENRGLIIHRHDYHVKLFKGEIVKILKKPSSTPSSFYKITDKGRIFLEMLK